MTSEKFVHFAEYSSVYLELYQR